MHVVMVMTVHRSQLTRLIATRLRVIVYMVVTVFMIVMPKMCGMVWRVFQGITNTHRCRIGGVQREHDGKAKREDSAHIGGV